MGSGVGAVASAPGRALGVSTRPGDARTPPPTRPHETKVSDSMSNELRVELPSSVDTPQERPADVAKDEAASVTSTAKQTAGDVASTAKEQAASVASEAGAQAKNLAGQAKSELTDQASTATQKLAGSLRALGEELSGMASHDAGSGMATNLAQQGAERTQALASWLEDREPKQLLDDASAYARQHPGTFLLLAAGAGVLAGRLVRGLRDDDADQATGSSFATSVPPTSVPPTSVPTSVPTTAPPPASVPPRTTVYDEVEATSPLNERL